MRMILWGAFQLAIIGFWLWVAYERQQAGEDPQVGLSLLLGVLCAFVLTAVPFVVKDVLAGQWGFWRGKFSGQEPGQPLRPRNSHQKQLSALDSSEGTQRHRP
jgi:hypothetical protein